MIELATVVLPEFGAEPVCPEIPVSLYEARLRKTTERLQQAGLDCLAVYGDREHFANLAYLTGFDPRFEESLLLLDRAGRRMLLVGNECLGYLPDPRLGCEVVLFQEFSLMGQVRGDSRPLGDILASFGVRKGWDVGAVGWKYFEGQLFMRHTLGIDLHESVLPLGNTPAWLPPYAMSLEKAFSQTVTSHDMSIRMRLREKCPVVAERCLPFARGRSTLNSLPQDGIL